MNTVDTTEPSALPPAIAEPSGLSEPAKQDEVSMPPTLWRHGPSVKITLPNLLVQKYKSRALVDASVILFLRDPEEKREEWTALEGHPLSSIAKSIERCEWHSPSAEALSAIGSGPTAGNVCFFGLETHFVREPLGNTFSACRLGLAARELGGMSAVAVVGLALGDVLLVRGSIGYAAIAKRSQSVSKAPMLWTLVDAQAQRT